MFWSTERLVRPPGAGAGLYRPLPDLPLGTARMEDLAGYDPATCRLEDGCAIQLRHRSNRLDGPAENKHPVPQLRAMHEPVAAAANACRETISGVAECAPT